LPDGESENFFAQGLDSPNQPEMIRENRFLAHAALASAVWWRGSSPAIHDWRSCRVGKAKRAHRWHAAPDRRRRERRAPNIDVAKRFFTLEDLALRSWPRLDATW